MQQYFQILKRETRSTAGVVGPFELERDPRRDVGMLDHQGRNLLRIGRSVRLLGSDPGTCLKRETKGQVVHPSAFARSRVIAPNHSETPKNNRLRASSCFLAVEHARQHRMLARVFKSVGALRHVQLNRRKLVVDAHPIP